MAANIAYLVHDLADASVHRRVRMLELGGAEIRLAGFMRGSASPAAFAIPCLNLGETADARLASRALSVAKALLHVNALAETVRGADIVIARNIEMLAIASKARDRFAPKAGLVYECLDLHRLLLSRGIAGQCLRATETALWRRADLLVTSSPAFVKKYFSTRGFPAPIAIVENKVLLEDAGVAPENRPESAPPWKIGYFGMLRCAKSLRILKALAKAGEGKIEVIIRGKFSPAIFRNIDAELEDAPYVHYLGPYSPSSLGRIYSEVHFSWAIDFYEESQNSSWLLPNRLYESIYAGAVPIALADVETGCWLKDHGAGVCLTIPHEDELLRFFSYLDGPAYDALAAHVARIPRRAVTSDAEDCRRLVALMGKKKVEISPEWIAPLRTVEGD